MGYFSFMQVTRKSQLTQITHTFDLNVTNEQLLAHANGKPAQDAFPQLNADDREFIISGITKEEWEQAFPAFDEKEDFNFDDMPEPVEDRLLDSAWESRNEAHELGENW